MVTGSQLLDSYESVIPVPESNSWQRPPDALNAWNSGGFLLRLSEHDCCEALVVENNIINSLLGMSSVDA